MPVIMVENPVKGSTITNSKLNMFRLRKIVLVFGICIAILQGAGCDDVVQQSQIPYVPFNNIEINLSNQQYLDLKTKGYIEISGGVKGIILYKNPSIEEYFAYEKNCSYQPLDDCAEVEIDGSGLFMVDPCCSSQFNFSEGLPIGGPATLPLRRYRTILNGNYLTITDEPL